jgi:hypothetical protein
MKVTKLFEGELSLYLLEGEHANGLDRIPVIKKIIDILKTYPLMHADQAVVVCSPYYHGLGRCFVFTAQDDEFHCPTIVPNHHVPNGTFYLLIRDREEEVFDA